MTKRKKWKGGHGTPVHHTQQRISKLGCFPGTKVRTGMRTTLTFADMIKAFFRQ